MDQVRFCFISSIPDLLTRLAFQTERMWAVISTPRSSSAQKIEDRCIAHLQATIKDPELVKKLTPDYPIGCKRIQFDPGYLPCLNRENVHLITDGIGKATATGLVTRTGQSVPADVIIFATGWGAFNMGRSYPIYGRGGVELWDRWLELGLPRAYQGAMVNNFPNLMLAVGPNTQVWSSFVEVMEMKVDLLVKMLKHMCLTNAKSFEPRLELEAQWEEFCKEGLKTTPYAAGCISYYKYQKSSPRINGGLEERFAGFSQVR
jgi:cation diffusion facilitator CzcD-associated flavoprotein CzcO